MKYVKTAVLPFFVCLVWMGCSKSNEEDLNNNNGGNNNPGGCNTTNVKYSTDIAPLIQANCFSCHSNATASTSGISLEGHANLKAKVTDGSLLGAISHAAGFSPMPQGGAKLSDCNINRIKAWIDAGALNN